MRRYTVLLFVLLGLTASKPQCDLRSGRTLCGTYDVLVEPGSCVELPDNCGNNWDELGAVALCDTHAGLWLEIERRLTGNTVRLCVSDDMPVILSEPIDYSYVMVDGSAWEGRLMVSTGLLLRATASASPELLLYGQSVHLGVVVSGGAQPYEYLWNLSGSIGGDLDVQNPVATPPVGEVFSVRVTDNGGQRVWANLLVDVVPEVVAVAIPSTIDAGESVSLNAGVTPGVFLGDRLGWTWFPDLPSGRPGDPGAINTSATPVVTTDYTYSVRTIYGNVSSYSVRVNVRP